MEKIFISKRTFDTEHKHYILKYYLTEKKNSGKVTCYGIGIEKYLIAERSEDFIEEEFIYNISHSEKVVKNLINKLDVNLVTPFSLTNIIDNYFK